MRARIQIDVEPLLDELRKLPDRGKKVGKEVVGQVTGEIAAAARAIAPDKTGALRGSVRATRPVMTARGVISGAVTAGGAGLAGHVGRGASAHVHAYRTALMATRAANVYGAVQEAGHERGRGGKEVVLHPTSGQAHFIEQPALKLAPTVPDRVIAALDREAA